VNKVFSFLVIVPLAVFSLYAYNWCTSSKRTTQETITAIINYPMSNVLARCKKDHNYNDEDMIILEQELKRYLTLAAVKSKDDLGNGMFSHDVDNLWHSFILFTNDYADFCTTHIGHFIHHVPEINEEKSPEQQEEAQKDFQAFIKNYEELFGEEIHPVWFLDMVA